MEFPTGLGGEVTEVIELLGSQSATLRSLAEHVHHGGIAVLQ